MLLATRRHSFALIALCLVSIGGTLLVYHGESIDLLYTYSSIYSLRSDSYSNSGSDSYEWLEPAGNSTLGFGSIEYLTLPYEFDRAATLTLQAKVTGLETNQNDAVAIDDIHPKLKGVPPNSKVATGKAKEMPMGVKACALSHMKLWQKLINSDQQTMFIVESDAMWSKNIRNESMTIAWGLHKLQEKMQNQTLPAPSPSDPFNSSNWDFLSFGTCRDKRRNQDQYVVVGDPHAADAKYYDLETLHEQRVVRKAGAMICTTAYAVSRKGALRLLLRSALNSNYEVDVLTEYMIADNKLTGYTAYPMPIVQWQYKKGLGADALGSNINDVKEAELPVNVKQLWDKAMKEQSVWEEEKGFIKIKDSALDEAKNYINSL